VSEERKDQITIDEFARLDLRVAEIIAAEKIEGADKLLQLKLSLGDDERQVVAGLAKYYNPQELVGRQVLFIANLKPVRLRGVLSEGMVLAATDKEGRLALTTVDDRVSPGSRVS